MCRFHHLVYSIFSLDILLQTALFNKPFFSIQNVPSTVDAPAACKGRCICCGVAVLDVALLGPAKCVAPAAFTQRIN